MVERWSVPYLVAFIFLVKNVARSLVEYKGVKQSWILQKGEEGVKL